MKSLRRRGRFLGLHRRHLFNIYLLVGSLSIVIATTIFTIQVSKNVEKQSYLTTKLFSHMASRWLAGEIKPDDPVLSTILEIDVPLIITGPGGRPIMWNEPVIGIPVLERHLLIAANPNRPTNPVVVEILSMAASFDQMNEPFAIISSDGRRQGTLHWGRSALSQRIRWMPYLELMIMALFFLMILWALQSKKEAQQKALFAGMAKEAAHQLGTPLTSIMGWVAILEDRVGAKDEVMVELNRDVDRLSKVSSRFSQIGSMPKLDDSDLLGIIDDAIVYFQRRLPHLGGRVELRREGTFSGSVCFNRDLLGWVLENLIKNGIDALIEGKGTITIYIEDTPEGGAKFVVADTGKGIPGGVGNRIFEPGYTTKKRGWGMGLALVKRIVTQYHLGGINVDTTSSHGTSISVWMPPAPGTEVSSDK